MTHNFLKSMRTVKTWAAAALILLGGALGTAQTLNLNSSNPSLSENFDSMWDASTMTNGTTENIALPSGWKVEANAKGPRQVGNWADAPSSATYSASENMASNQANGTYCWGASSNVSDRAIGGLSTGSTANTDGKSRGTNLMAHFKNNDPTQILTNLKLNYNIEKYRTGNNGAGFSVRLYTSKDGENWTEAEGLDTYFAPDADTNGAAVVPVSTTPVKDALLRVHVEPGEDLYLAWNVSATSGTTCSGAQGLAIDDIKIEGVFAATDDEWEDEQLPDFVASGIYLRGEVNSWAAEQAWEFSKLSDTEYALYNKTLSGQFKIADSNWSSINYGSDGNNITMGAAYTLDGGSNPGNISCGNLSFPCSRILLTISNGTATLLLEPNTKTTGLTAIYMVGDFNDWNYMNQDGKLTLDPNDNLFKGQIGLTEGGDGLSHWMIYQRLALAGAWGLNSDATTSTTNGTLVAGKTGHVATAPGMYEVTFNLSNGAYTLTKLSSTATAINLTPAATTLVPEVPEKVKVLSLNNSLIHYNDQAKVFNEIAESMNKDAYWTKHTNLGKTLDYHWQEGDGMTEAGEPGAKMMVRSDAWSHIILQEQTILPRTDFEAFRNSVKNWVEYIRENCPNPNAVIIVPLNWALAQDWSNFSDYNSILVDNYTKVAKEFGVVICPVGLAYQSKYVKDGGSKTESEWFLPGDDRHPTLKATYLAALMEYALIYNEDPTKVTYYPNYTTEYDKVGEMSDAIAAEMRQYASNALKEYDNAVNHHEKTLAMSAEVVDQYDLPMAGETITWSVTPSGASINNGLFTATEKGEYTVTATSGNLSATALVRVADAITVVPDLGWISLDEKNLDYTQDFNSMGQDAEAEIPAGWRADRLINPRTLGTFQGASQTTSYSGGAGFGSSAKNGIWNLGDSSDENDRALGGITTDVEGGAKSINVYAAFRNDGNKSISSIDLSYNVEKYRDGSNSAGFTVQLYYSVDGRNWKSAGSEFTTSFEPSTETIGSDVVPMETKHETGTLEYDMAPGAELYLAWNISATTGESCMSAPVLAIDDVELNANLKPVPTYDYYIYIDNQSGYPKSALYAWSESEPSEIFGAWPGQNPIDVVKIGETNYEVYGHNQASGNYHLIYNNNNNGSQYNDYDIEGGADYYLKANPDGKTMEVSVTSIESLENGASGSSLVIYNGVAFCQEAVSMSLYNTSGMLMGKTSGAEISIESLSPGLYVIVAETASGNISRKFMKN